MSRQRRAAFTLIELLVVIAIIAILAGLTLAGVMRFVILAPKLQTQSDIGQFNTSLANFKAKYNVYPPSKIKLCSNRSEYGGTALDNESVKYLTTMWPKLGNWTNVQWSGSGANLPAGGVTLDGDQCLVFFLGGIPLQGATPGYRGFSPDVTNPANLSVPGGVFTKFFEFNAARLFQRGGSPFFSYKDGYGGGMPYLYFSSGFRANGYNSNGTVSHAIAMNVTVNPFFSAANNFHKADTYQIVSAGPDGLFGPGGLWNSSTPAVGTGADDLTNIQAAQMGVYQP